jgi:hypothetical protein
MPRPEFDENIRREVERVRKERLLQRIAVRNYTETGGRETLPPRAPVIDYAELDARTVQIVESYIEAALERERQSLVEITRTMTDFVEKTAAAMDRMKAHVDRLHDTLKHSISDDTISAERRQRMQAH